MDNNMNLNEINYGTFSEEIIEIRIGRDITDSIETAQPILSAQQAILERRILSSEDISSTMKRLKEVPEKKEDCKALVAISIIGLILCSVLVVHASIYFGILATVLALLIIFAFMRIKALSKEELLNAPALIVTSEINEEVFQVEELVEELGVIGEVTGEIPREVPEDMMPV